MKRWDIKMLTSFGQESYIVMDSKQKENSYQTKDHLIALTICNALNGIADSLNDKYKRFFIGKWRKHSDGEFYAYLPSSCVMGDLAILKNKKNDYFELVVVTQHIETDSKWNYAWFSYTTVANKMERYDASLFANGDNSRWFEE